MDTKWRWLRQSLLKACVPSFPASTVPQACKHVLWSRWQSICFVKCSSVEPDRRQSFVWVVDSRGICKRTFPSRSASLPRRRPRTFLPLLRRFARRGATFPRHGGSHVEVLFARLSSSSVRTSAIRSVQLFSCTQGRVLFLLLRGARAVEESHRGVASMRRCNRIRHCLAADWIDTFSKDLDLMDRDLPERLDGTHGAGRSGSEVPVRKERKGDLSWTDRGFERGELVDEPHASGQDGGGARSERSTCRGGPDGPTRHLCVRRASFRVPKERLPPRLLVLARGDIPSSTVQAGAFPLDPDRREETPSRGFTRG